MSPVIHQKLAISLGLEVRYDRAFLTDLKNLDPVSFHVVQRFVFEQFYGIHQLAELPNLHQIRNSDIFYRFTLDRHLIALEVTGQIVKFLRVLPLPKI